jgi:chromosomal replication initiator protein
MEKNFGDLLRSCARTLFGEDLHIDFEVGELPPGASSPEQEDPKHLEHGGEAKRAELLERSKTGGVPFPKHREDSPSPKKVKALQRRELNSDFTFETFVVGPSNRVAHAASIAVSDYPGKTYNPLFIYGESGVGKTHLLHAICHRILATTRLRIAYLTSEDFLNQYIASVVDSNLDHFRSQCRDTDVLVIDDLQFLSSKDKTQDELFHTFNVLMEEQKQMILSSRSSPGDATGIQDRLTSRLRWGLVTRMEAPMFETRVAILVRKARWKNYELPMDVAEFVAAHVGGNVRELEGALSCVLSVASFQKAQLNLAVAKDALSETLVEEKSTGAVTIANILQAVESYYQVKPKDLLCRTKVRSIVFPRQVGMFLARELTQLSLAEIGMHFGGRDHTTVLYATERIHEILQANPAIRRDIQVLKSRISADRRG